MITAYQLEHAQEWSGCILSQQSVDRFPKEVEEMLEEGLIVPYHVPLKEGLLSSPCSQYVVNWCLYEESQKELRRSRLIDMKEKAPKEGLQKIDNTILFLEEMYIRNLYSVKQRTMQAYNLPKNPDLPDSGDQDN